MTYYQDVFALRLRHDFYADGKCADFMIVPLGAARRFFTARRLIVRAEDVGLRVFAPTRDGKLIVPLDGVPALLFGLKPTNTELGLYTDFKEDSPAHRATWQAGQQLDQLWFDRLPTYIFSHDAGDVALTEQPVYDFHAHIPIVLSTDAPFIIVSLKDHAGRLIATAEFQTELPPSGGPNRHLETSLEVSDLPEGLYELTTSLAAQPPVPILVRSDLDKRYKRLILLSFADTDLMTAAEETQPVRTYTAEFHALAREWAYQLVLTSKNIDKTYKVEHVPQNGDAAIQFGDPVIGPVADGERNLVIRSNGVVGFREMPRRGIKLKQVITVPGEGGAPPTVTESEVISHLPNPSPRQVNADIFVRV